MVIIFLYTYIHMHVTLKLIYILQEPHFIRQEIMHHESNFFNFCILTFKCNSGKASIIRLVFFLHSSCNVVRYLLSTGPHSTLPITSLETWSIPRLTASNLCWISSQPRNIRIQQSNFYSSSTNRGCIISFFLMATVTAIIWLLCGKNPLHYHML